MGREASSVRGRSRGRASGIPRHTGVYELDVKSIVAHGVEWTNHVPGRLEAVRRARAEGVTLPPVQLVVTKEGRFAPHDGNHRLRAAIEAGDKTITAHVTAEHGTRLTRHRKKR